MLKHFSFSFVQVLDCVHCTFLFQLCTCSGMCLLYNHYMSRNSNSKVMPQLSCYLSFLLEKGGKPLCLKPYLKSLKFASASSDQPLQCTSLDLQCVCDALQNCPTLQNFMYILHEFHTFPVTEGNKILHLHFSS